MRVTKDTIIGDLLRADAGFANVLMYCGMHCVYCPSALGETLEEAALVHGMDVDDILDALHDYQDAKQYEQ
ncbi:MAG: DUF1858 domain-containing protein [bacterium]